MQRKGHSDVTEPAARFQRARKLVAFYRLKACFQEYPPDGEPDEELPPATRGFRRNKPRLLDQIILQLTFS